MELRQYYEILRRHKWLVIQVTVACAVLLGVLSSLGTPQYRATSRVLLRPDDPAEQLNPEQGSRPYRDPNRYVDAQEDIVRSEAVGRAAADSLQGVTLKQIEKRLSVGSGDQSDVLTVSAVDSSRRRAREISSAVAKSYIENRRQYAIAGLQKAVEEINTKLGSLNVTIADLDARIAILDAPAGSRPPTPSTSTTSTTAPPAGSVGALILGNTPEALKTAREAAAVQYESLFNRQQELVVNISLKRGEAELIEDARMPDAPFSPRPIRNGVLGGVVGLLLGAGIALVREHMDDRFRSASEIERVLGLPILAQLPADDAAMANDKEVTAVTRTTSPLSEAARSLRTSIQYFDLDRPLKVIVVTSAVPSEGKSLVSANLAVVYAQAGYRTLLVSADLRRAGVTRYFDTGRTSKGLTGVIAPGSENGRAAPANGASGEQGSAANSDAARMANARMALVATQVPNLAFLPPGPVPPNPAELLNSQRMTQLLAEFERIADIVIVDTPPLLPVTDAAVLAARADGVVLVTALGETRRDAAIRAKEIVQATGARILGLVVNKVPTTASGYYYQGDYGNPPAPSKGRWRRKRSSMAAVTSEQ